MLRGCPCRWEAGCYVDWQYCAAHRRSPPLAGAWQGTDLRSCPHALSLLSTRPCSSHVSQRPARAAAQPLPFPTPCRLASAAAAPVPAWDWRSNPKLLQLQLTWHSRGQLCGAARRRTGLLLASVLPMITHQEPGGTCAAALSGVWPGAGGGMLLSRVPDSEGGKDRRRFTTQSAKLHAQVASVIALRSEGGLGRASAEGSRAQASGGGRASRGRWAPRWAVDEAAAQPAAGAQSSPSSSPSSPPSSSPSSSSPSSSSRGRQAARISSARLRPQPPLSDTASRPAQLVMLTCAGRGPRGGRCGAGARGARLGAWAQAAARGRLPGTWRAWCARCRAAAPCRASSRLPTPAAPRAGHAASCAAPIRRGCATHLLGGHVHGAGELHLVAVARRVQLALDAAAGVCGVGGRGVGGRRAGGEAWGGRAAEVPGGPSSHLGTAAAERVGGDRGRGALERRLGRTRPARTPARLPRARDVGQRGGAGSPARSNAHAHRHWLASLSSSSSSQSQSSSVEGQLAAASAALQLRASSALPGRASGIPGAGGAARAAPIQHHSAAAGARPSPHSPLHCQSHSISSLSHCSGVGNGSTKRVNNTSNVWSGWRRQRRRRRQRAAPPVAAAATRPAPHLVASRVGGAGALQGRLSWSERETGGQGSCEGGGYQRGVHPLTSAAPRPGSRPGPAHAPAVPCRALEARKRAMQRGWRLPGPGSASGPGSGGLTPPPRQRRRPPAGAAALQRLS